MRENQTNRSFHVPLDIITFTNSFLVTWQKSTWRRDREKHHETCNLTKRRERDRDRQTDREIERERERVGVHFCRTFPVLRYYWRPALLLEKIRYTICVRLVVCVWRGRGKRGTPMISCFLCPRRIALEYLDSWENGNTIVEEKSSEQNKLE